MRKYLNNSKVCYAMVKTKEKINDNLIENYPVKAFGYEMKIFRVVYSDPKSTRFFKNPYKIIGPANAEYIVVRSDKNNKLMLAIDMVSKERALPNVLFRDNGDIRNPSDFEVIDRQS